MVFASVLALWSGALPLGAQDDETGVVVDGSQAQVTVVARGEITLGPPAPGSVPDWPYVCVWAEAFADTEVILGRTIRPTPGHRYWLGCTPTRDGVPAIGQFVVYDPLDPVPGVDAITSIELAEVARGVLDPTPLPVGVSPADLQITGVETFLWPDGATESVQQTASANGLAVTVEARWSHTVFDMDEPDREPIVCEAKVEWSPGVDESPCSHTYLSEGDGRTITATSHWDFVWWDNAGQPVPVFVETVELVEELVIDVVDLEAVITARR